MRATWTQPKEYTDGSPFEANQFAGYEIQIDRAPIVSVPIAWQESGVYSLELEQLAPAPGPHTLRIMTVTVDGQHSDWSEDAGFDYVRKPRRPFGLSVS